MAGGGIGRGEGQPRHAGEGARQHALLHLAGQLQLALQPLLLGDALLRLFQRLDLELQLLHQPGALHGDGRVAGQRLQQGRLAGRELVAPGGLDEHQPGGQAVGHQRHGQPGAQGWRVGRHGDARRRAKEWRGLALRQPLVDHVAGQAQPDLRLAPAVGGQHLRPVVGAQVVERATVGFT